MEMTRFVRKRKQRQKKKDENSTDESTQVKNDLNIQTE